MSARPRSSFSEEKDGSGVKGFMCLTDFDFELGSASGGNRIYPSIENLRANRKCVAGCGIVEVRVVGISIIQPEVRDA